MDRKYSITPPRPAVNVRAPSLPHTSRIDLLRNFRYGPPFFPPSSLCSSTPAILFRESVSFRIFRALNEHTRRPGSEKRSDDQNSPEHHDIGQQPQRPPLSPSTTMSMGERGHSPNTPNSGTPAQTNVFRYSTLGGSPLLSPADSSSLSINYLPTKFGAGLVSRKRHGKGLSGIRKQGGGREAFKADESRMPGANDEDYDGVQGGWFRRGSKKPALRWTKFKWIMFAANIFVRPPSINFSVPPLIIRFTVDDILHGFPHSLPAHMVPRLGSGEHRPCWKQGRAHHFHHCRRSGHRDLLNRLGRHSPQQPWFPRMVHLPVVDLFCLPRCPRLHHLQEAHFQLGRKAQQAVVADFQCWWPLIDPESARVLWIL